jgi:hypothetical protein
LEKLFRASSRVLNTPVWSPRMCGAVLACGLLLLVTGTLKLHAHWHPYENAYQTPWHYFKDVVGVSAVLIYDLWPMVLGAFSLFGATFYALRIGVLPRGWQNLRRLLTGANRHAKRRV